VVVTNEAGEVIYAEQVPEIVDEPNYKAALEALMDA
jgi:thiol peroxidase